MRHLISNPLPHKSYIQRTSDEEEFISLIIRVLTHFSYFKREITSPTNDLLGFICYYVNLIPEEHRVPLVPRSDLIIGNIRKNCATDSRTGDIVYKFNSKTSKSYSDGRAGTLSSCYYTYFWDSSASLFGKHEIFFFLLMRLLVGSSMIKVDHVAWLSYQSI